MKNKIVSLIVITLAITAGAAQLATQEWVNKYFARRQNQEFKPVEAISPASTGEFTDPTQPGVTFELVAVLGTEDAFVVSESTIPGIPDGTYYAKSASGSWKNVHNTTVSEFTVTKIPFNSTNELGASVIKYYDYLESADKTYVSIISDGVMRIYKSGNKSVSMRITETKITSEYKNNLIGE